MFSFKKSDLQIQHIYYRFDSIINTNKKGLMSNDIGL